MLSVCLWIPPPPLTSECLNQFFYETWCVYHGNWAQLKGLATFAKVDSLYWFCSQRLLSLLDGFWLLTTVLSPQHFLYHCIHTSCRGNAFIGPLNCNGRLIGVYLAPLFLLSGVILHFKGKSKVVPVLNYLSTIPWRHMGEWRYSSIFLYLYTFLHS
jgi:hypothetical protein